MYQEAVTIETEVKTEMKDIASEMLPLLSRRILALKLVLGSCIDQPTTTPESAEVDGTALRAQITAWGQEKTALPFMGFNELGTFAEMAVMKQKFGEGATSSDDLEAQTLQWKHKDASMRLLKSRVSTAVSKSKKEIKDAATVRELPAAEQLKEQQKILAAERKRCEAEQKKMERAICKIGVVENIFDIDFSKLGVPALKLMNAAEFQAMANAPAAQGKLDCPWVAKYDSKPDVITNVVGTREALAALSCYYAGFPGSPAALKGKKRSSTVVSNTEEQRKNLLLACGLQEALFAHNETKELIAWGYGDTMVNVGCDVQQLASLRLQTQGYRQFIAIAASSLINFLKDKHMDSEGGVKLPMIATFVYQMSAADAAELITKMPNGVASALHDASTDSCLLAACLDYVREGPQSQVLLRSSREFAHSK